jgi:hypothetical protein
MLLLPKLTTNAPITSVKFGFRSLALLSIHLAVRLRALLFLVLNKLLPNPLNGADLLIIGKVMIRNKTNKRMIDDSI